MSESHKAFESHGHIREELTEEDAGWVWRDSDGYYWIWMDKKNGRDRGFCCMGRSLRGMPDDYYYEVLPLDGENSKGPYTRAALA